MEAQRIPEPSPDAAMVLRAHGWSPDRVVDISAWTEMLRRDGNEVFPLAQEIVRTFGGLRLDGGDAPRGSMHAIQIDPSLWYGEREQVEAVEGLTGSRACPLGEVYGGAMLAVLEDGRIVSDLSGDIAVLGQDLRAALDLLVLGRGSSARLARNYLPLQPEANDD